MPAPVLSDHDPRWSAAAQRWITAIRQATSDVPGSEHVVLEHIGSTAVPGIAAKPVLDLQARTPVLPSEAVLERVLGPLGFAVAHGSRPDSPGVHRDVPRPGADPDPRLYRKRLLTHPGADDGPPVILHVRRTDSPFAAYVTDFRDWLRSEPAEAAAYEATKRHLAARHADADDYDDYTRDKTVFLDDAQARLERWLAGRARTRGGQATP